VRPDPGYDLVVGSGWTGLQGGMHRGYEWAQMETWATVFPLSGGSGTQINYSYNYPGGWGESLWIHDSASDFTPSSEGFLLNWTFDFYGGSNGSWGGIGDINLGVSTELAAVSEPTAMLLLGIGLIGLAGARRKFQK